MVGFFLWLAKDRVELQHGSMCTYLVLFFVFGLGMYARYNLVQI